MAACSVDGHLGEAADREGLCSNPRLDEHSFCWKHKGFASYDTYRGGLVVVMKAALIILSRLVPRGTSKEVYKSVSRGINGQSQAWI